MSAEATPSRLNEVVLGAAALAAVGALSHADAVPLLMKTAWPLGVAAIVIALAEFAWAVVFVRRGPTPMLLRAGAAGGAALVVLYVLPFVFSAVWPGFPAPPVDPAGTVDAVAGLTLCVLCVTMLRGRARPAMATVSVALAALLLAILVAGSHGSPPPASAKTLDRVSFVCHLG